VQVLNEFTNVTRRGFAVLLATVKVTRRAAHDGPRHALIDAREGSRVGKANSCPLSVSVSNSRRGVGIPPVTRLYPRRSFGNRSAICLFNAAHYPLIRFYRIHPDWRQWQTIQGEAATWANVRLRTDAYFHLCHCGD
jgi:hypothetical protein